MGNRLAAQRSPYLLQHADDPVDWYAWGPEAFERARAENRPVLVSIGYAACHWCHVMARESFADPGTAADMNAHFVCVKVDREERPDLDALYMAAAHAIAGRGGWPLNVFLTPAQVPFFAGTYFPETARHGLPAWRTVLAAVADAWATRRFQIDIGAERILGRLAGDAAAEPSARPFAADDLRLARERLAAAHDDEHGGFGGAPKFPPACALEFLLGQGERAMTGATLRAMAAGGIYDQLGGGFARYAVDAAWSVPHFEKMLHDNALLARAYLHGWQVLGDGRLRDVCCETLDWALRELALPGGGFGAALDADTEGVEGAFYTWRAEELVAALGEAAAAAGTATAGGHAAPDEAATFGLAMSEELGERGVLVLSDPDRPPSPALRERLLAVRARRPPPARDDTCISAWNALMIGALAEAGAVLERADYLAAASACAEHLLATLRRPDGRVLRTAAGAAGGLQDHAFLVEALLDLYAATFAPRWFRAARETADVMIARFADERRGGFFETADDHERLIARRKDLGDRPMPSGSSSAALGLLRLAALTGEAGYERRAEGALRLVHETAIAHPDGFGHALQAIAFALAEPREVALVGADTRPLVRVVRAAFRPHVVLAGGAADGVPLLEGRGRVDGPATAYVCERFACRQPVSDPAELAALL